MSNQYVLWSSDPYSPLAVYAKWPRTTNEYNKYEHKIKIHSNVPETCAFGRRFDAVLVAGVRLGCNNSAVVALPMQSDHGQPLNVTNVTMTGRYVLAMYLKLAARSWTSFSWSTSRWPARWSSWSRSSLVSLISSSLSSNTCCQEKTGQTLGFTQHLRDSIHSNILTIIVHRDCLLLLYIHLGDRKTCPSVWNHVPNYFNARMIIPQPKYPFRSRSSSVEIHASQCRIRKRVYNSYSVGQNGLPCAMPQ